METDYNYYSEEKRKYDELRRKRKAMWDEISRLDEALRDLNRKIKASNVKEGTSIWYFHISKETHEFGIFEMIYKGYPAQKKIIRSGIYFLSEMEIVQFVDDMQASLFKIAQNRLNGNKKS